MILQSSSTVGSRISRLFPSLHWLRLRRHSIEIRAWMCTMKSIDRLPHAANVVDTVMQNLKKKKKLRFQFMSIGFVLFFFLFSRAWMIICSEYLRFHYDAQCWFIVVFLYCNRSLLILRRHFADHQCERCAKLQLQFWQITLRCCCLCVFVCFFMLQFFGCTYKWIDMDDHIFSS